MDSSYCNQELSLIYVFKKSASFVEYIMYVSIRYYTNHIHKGHKFNSRYKPYKDIEYAQEGRVTVAVGTRTLKSATSCA